MILCIGTTPAAQRVMIFNRVAVDHVNRAILALDGVAGKSINVAKVLHALGVPVTAVGFLGGPRGRQIEALVETRGIAREFVTVSAPTRECVTVIDQSANTVTELVEESRPVEPADFERLLEIVRRHVAQCKAVILSGTVAGGGPPDFYSRCVRMAREAGAIPFVDASGAVLLDALTAGPELVKPNRAELAATAGTTLEDHSALLRAVQHVHGKGARYVVVTDGAKPALASDGAQTWRVSSPEIAAINPIGSGDAFTAALVWRLTLGDSLADACRWGAAAGAANALTPMAGEVNRAEVEQLIGQVKLTQDT